ncbi:hypothetical protein GCM10023116_15930 [Kistimonas scapharcae]|uniref:Uncharacterized protein n=1 Tax=Kistimonas scapharcae TaxID=1036133 RepID=A0ABP8V1N2_9GAMM
MSKIDKQCTIFDLIMACAVCTVISIGGAYLAYSHAVTQSDTDAQKIVVVNYAGLIRNIHPSVANETVEQTMMELGQDLARIAEQGYLVLDNQYVIAGGDRYELDLSKYINRLQEAE